VSVTQICRVSSFCLHLCPTGRLYSVHHRAEGERDGLKQLCLWLSGLAAGKALAAFPPL